MIFQMHLNIISFIIYKILNILNFSSKQFFFWNIKAHESSMNNIYELCVAQTHSLKRIYPWRELLVCFQFWPNERYVVHDNLTGHTIQTLSSG